MIHIAADIELVLDAVAHDRREPHPSRYRLALVVPIQHPLSLGPHAHQDVQGRADNLVNESVVNRRHLLPGGEAVRVLHAPRRPIDLVEFAILADPEVRQRIDAENAVMIRRGLVNDFDQPQGVVGIELQNVEVEQVSVLAGAAALGIDQRNGSSEFGCQLQEACRSFRFPKDRTRQSAVWRCA